MFQVKLYCPLPFWIQAMQVVLPTSAVVTLEPLAGAERGEGVSEFILALLTS